MDYPNLCHGCFADSSSKNPCSSCGYVPDNSKEAALYLAPGTTLAGKYLVGKILGQGGFGITYLAWDNILKIKLAIKEYLPQQLATRSAGQNTITIYKSTLAEEFRYGLAKFLEEARTLARFNEHPNIVSVRDYFEANNTAYLVMNYHEGVTLESYLESKGGKIPVEQALAIFMPVLDALKEVHAAGILHRDISPDNLLIDKNGRVILIDFGAARQAIGERSKSLSVIMKAGYSPPEQYQSRGKQGPWTDIYAAAATMYRAITGQVPLEAIDRMVEDDFKLPSELGMKLDPGEEQILLKALSVKTDERYQTVDDFQAALLAIQPDTIKEENTAEQSKSARHPLPLKLKSCPYCNEDINADTVSCFFCRTYLGEVKPEVMVYTFSSWIRIALSTGLPYGIIMGIYFAWIDGRMEIGILLGIGSGLLFGLFSTLYMRWFISRNQPDRPDFISESVLIEGPANLSRGLKAVGGYLWITDRRVHFAPHSYYKQKLDRTELLSEIIDCQIVKTFFLFDVGFSVKTYNAENHRFVVNNSRRWVDVLQQLITEKVRKVTEQF